MPPAGHFLKKAPEKRSGCRSFSFGPCGAERKGVGILAKSDANIGKAGERIPMRHPGYTKDAVPPSWLSAAQPVSKCDRPEEQGLGAFAKWGARGLSPLAEGMLFLLSIPPPRSQSAEPGQPLRLRPRRP